MNTSRRQTSKVRRDRSPHRVPRQQKYEQGKPVAGGSLVALENRLAEIKVAPKPS